VSSKDNPDYSKSSYSTIKKNLNLKKEMDEKKTFWINDENYFYYEPTTIENPEDLFGRRLLMNILAQIM